MKSPSFVSWLAQQSAFALASALLTLLAAEWIAHLRIKAAEKDRGQHKLQISVFVAGDDEFYDVNAVKDVFGEMLGADTDVHFISSRSEALQDQNEDSSLTELARIAEFRRVEAENLALALSESKGRISYALGIAARKIRVRNLDIPMVWVDFRNLDDESIRCGCAPGRIGRTDAQFHRHEAIDAAFQQ